MSFVEREYRLRFAELGAPEVEGHVAFVLDLGYLKDAPVVAGSIVNPLGNSTDMRPFHVEGVDRTGQLIRYFAQGGRWRIIGRLVDVQFRDPDDFGAYGEKAWTTYGTGRCSGIAERRGPGCFQVEVSDESWVARKDVFHPYADTTVIWPSGVKGEWSGFPEAEFAWAEVIDDDGDAYKIRMWAGDLGGNLGPEQGYRGREITDLIRRWVRSDLIHPDDRDISPASPGNFQHLRLSMLSEEATQDRLDWPIITFGELGAGPSPFPSDLFDTLDDPEVLFDGTVNRTWRIEFWVKAPPGRQPYEVGLSSAWLHAPTAPPSRDLPQHLGATQRVMWGTMDHPYATPVPQNGWMHKADLTRRIWQAMGVRYDEANLAAFEADTTLPAIAPRLFSIPANPERWMQENVWSPELVALKDRRGRRKLVDLRPPGDLEVEELPVLDVTNTRDHRWFLRGREQMNSVAWRYSRITTPDERPEAPGRTAVQVANFPEDPHTLDWFLTQELESPPIESSDVDLIGRRQRVLEAYHVLADPFARPSRVVSVEESGVGVPFFEVQEGMAEFLLELYRDGPMYGQCVVGRGLAESIEEGDYVVVDQFSLKGANPFTAARSGGMLVLVLSLTRHPAHADLEYIVVRPVQIWACPDPELPATWLRSPMGSHATLRVRFPQIPPQGAGHVLQLKIEARKNAEGGQQVDLGLELDNGGAAISTWFVPDLSHEWETFNLPTDLDETAQITDWSRLFVNLSRLGDEGGPEADQRRMDVRLLELCYSDIPLEQEEEL